MTQTRNIKLRLCSLATALALALVPPAFAGQVNTGGLHQGGQYNRFIIRFANNSPEASNSVARQNALDSAGRAHGVAIAHLLKLAVGADAIKTDRKLDRIDAEALMRRLANNPNVEFVEIDKLNKIVSTPNDSYYSQQWQYFNSAGGIKANEAWDLTTGAGAVVAVLDTGITNHSDLNANVLPGYDFIKDTSVSVDGNGRDSDASDPGDWFNNSACGSGGPVSSNSSWHGTHVAGTVAAVTNNAKGVAGTAFGARIVPARVLGRCGGYDSDIADAIVWASGGTVSGVPANANPAEVISLSLGGSGACGSTTQSAINSAVSRGSTLVIAAGNDNANVSGSSPANCANVIAVGSTTSSGARSSFSNYGAGVDVAAPGSSILSTLNAGTTTPGAEAYATYSGTSMATPHVAGVVALMQAHATTPKTPAEVESLIKSTARAFPSTPSQPIGSGIVNARAAVEAVNGSASPPPPTSPPPSTSSLSNGVAKTGLSASAGTSLNFSLAVPAGATGLKFVMSGGTGNADMYVKFGSAPTDTSYDCRPYRAGNAETCNISTAKAGTYYVRIKARTSFSGAALTGSYGTGTSSSGTVLSNGVAVSLPSVATGGVSANYTLLVPAGKTTLTFSISGGTGDADLYVRRDAAPTSSSYHCRPYKTGNSETCTFSSPVAATYYVNVRAYAAYSGVSLTGTYSP